MANGFGIGNWFQPLGRSVVADRFYGAFRRSFHNRVVDMGAWVFEEAEDAFQVSAGGFQNSKTILFMLGERLFVRKYNTFFIWLRF